MSFGINRCFGGGILGACLMAVLSPAAFSQTTRGPRDYLDSDPYGHRQRDNVFSDDPYHADHSLDNSNSRRGRVRPDAEDDKSFSQAYPYAPPTRARRPVQAVEPRPFTRPANRYRDNRVRNDYAGVPVHRHYYGGEDRYDAPGYLDDAGRASAFSNGYSRRGVEEFTGGYGGGVRLDDVYPLKRDVNPRRYRGRMLNGEVSNDDEDASGANEVEDFVRSELSVRPGANLRVSSTGTYSYRNYIDQGNQVHARFRQPIHKKWQFGQGP